jgi:hypothetical protein
MSIYVTAFWVWLAFAGLATGWFGVACLIALIRASRKWKGGKHATRN